MKPTVINNTSENPHQPQHDQQPNMNNANNCQAQNDHSRRFPQFRHGFGGFDDPDGDVFADMGLRSRLNRMGNPFDWSARKRRGSGQNAGDAYDHHYFDDVDFPFGSTWDAFGRMGNKRHPAETADRSGFFDYVPQEFRQYVPEHFGTHFRGGHGHPHQQQQPQQQAPPPQQQQQAPPQQQQTYQQTGSKSNLCDAAIQTDDLGTQNNGDRRDGPNSADHHDNRNDSNVNRSSSSASSSSSSTPYGNQVHMSTSADGPGAHASASAGNNQNQYYQQSPNYAHQAPPYGRQYQQPYAPQYQYSQSPPPPPPQPHPSQEGFVRNVPIVLEETGTPVNKVRAETSAAPATPPTSQTGSNKARPEPLNKESFASNEPIPMPCPPQPGSQNQQQPQQHSDNQDDADSAPPQTPHTADCISKIQAIQRDVLELMLAVEQFGGKRGDKDYAYLDEMLTRNLLKLDTIDTNGKESIRLARKEAIKCIQTSIAVLEAKSDLHLNEKRDSIDQLNKETAESGNNSEPAAVPSDEKPAEKMDVEETNAEQSSASTEQNVDANADIPKVENITIDDKPTNGNEKPPQNEAENKPEKSSATPENADAKK
ncbi:BAG domain-containing protein Samui isoform X2 [Sitodiplosis mosellana]|uniref:BAG domain-containing protein Samui isoform X2 n=1 Tax=Sitodiplosis mosellana TaxID=263140 RepID=UPI002444842B|nr:BAG domain-containing protein Samui isoform X2 [Sitodiplosis mosellana]XP_055313780.1 BAG domain-containing protein Samui isoform X2 [Sitodiplosis mosellana]